MPYFNYDLNNWPASIKVEQVEQLLMQLYQQSSKFFLTYTKAIEKGPITVKFVPAREMSSDAKWCAGTREIKISLSSESPITALLFEMCNAANSVTDKMGNEMIKHYETAYDYALALEKEEFKSCQKFHEILNGFLKSKILLAILTGAGISKLDLLEAKKEIPETLSDYLTTVQQKDASGLSHMDHYRARYHQFKALMQIQENIKQIEALQAGNCYDVITSTSIQKLLDENTQLQRQIDANVFLEGYKLQNRSDSGYVISSCFMGSPMAAASSTSATINSSASNVSSKEKDLADLETIRLWTPLINRELESVSTSEERRQQLREFIKQNDRVSAKIMQQHSVDRNGVFQAARKVP